VSYQGVLFAFAMKKVLYVCSVNQKAGTKFHLYL
jgi:hypothetical protein